MDRLPRVTDVQYLDGRKLRLVFSDGLVREFDFEGVSHWNSGNRRLRSDFSASNDRQNIRDFMLAEWN